MDWEVERLRRENEMRRKEHLEACKKIDERDVALGALREELLKAHAQLTYAQRSNARASEWDLSEERGICISIVKSFIERVPESPSTMAEMEAAHGNKLIHRIVGAINERSYAQQKALDAMKFGPSISLEPLPKPAPAPVATSAVPMVLHCPMCRERHIDGSVMKEHHTHACQLCGFVWRPALINTVGVKFLPGFKD